MSLVDGCKTKKCKTSINIKSLYLMNESDVRNLGLFLMGEQDFSVKRKYGKFNRPIIKVI